MRIILSIIFSITLTSCSILYFGAGEVILDHTERSTGRLIADAELEVVITHNISNNSQLDHTNINVSVYNGNVLLYGQLSTAQQKKLTHQITNKLRGVRQIFNHLILANQNTYLIQANDTLISSRVRYAIWKSRDLTSKNFRVISEDSTVFLMGICTESDARILTKITSKITGVKKVVNLLEYLPE